MGKIKTMIFDFSNGRSEIMSCSQIFYLIDSIKTCDRQETLSRPHETDNVEVFFDVFVDTIQGSVGDNTR